MEGPLATCAASKMIKEKDPLLFEKIMAYNRNCEDESLLQYFNAERVKKKIEVYEKYRLSTTNQSYRIAIKRSKMSESMFGLYELYVITYNLYEQNQQFYKHVATSKIKHKSESTYLPMQRMEKTKCNSDIKAAEKTIGRMLPKIVLTRKYASYFSNYKRYPSDCSNKRYKHVVSSIKMNQSRIHSELRDESVYLEHYPLLMELSKTKVGRIVMSNIANQRRSQIIPQKEMCYHKQIKKYQYVISYNKSIFKVVSRKLDLE